MSRASLPPTHGKPANAPSHHDQALRLEQAGLLGFVAPEAAQRPSCAHDTVTGDARPAAGRHDRAHGSRRTRTPGGSRDIPIGRHPPAGDGPNRCQDTSGELRR